MEMRADRSKGRWGAGAMLESLSAFLFAPQMPLWRWCLQAFVLAVVPTVIGVLLVVGTLHLAGIDWRMLARAPTKVSASSALLIVLLAPLFETFLLAVGIHVLQWLSKRKGFVVAVSAILWGIMHALGGVLAFVGTAWSFFVMSCGYLTWHERDPAKGFLAAAVPHLLNNALAFGALVYFTTA